MWVPDTVQIDKLKHKNVKPSFFTDNRAKLLAKLSGGVLVLSAYTKMQRMSDMAAAFEQEPNFWYLTGIEHPDWMLICDGTTGGSWLVAPKIDAVHDLFDGSLSASEAKRISGVDRVVSADEGTKLLRQLARKHSVVYTIDQPLYAKHYGFTLNPSITTLRQKLERIFTHLRDANKELNSMRAIKQPEEVVAIKKAVARTCESFEAIKQKINTFKYEYEIAAEFDYDFRRFGTAGHAYDPIVASGVNACTLHYTANNARLKKPSLVLMDVGAKVDGYAADITRTYACGTITKRQKQVHEAVQQAHAEIVALLRPELSVVEYQQRVNEIMKNALKDLGLRYDEDSLRKYFPHAISHGLGVDVHDSLNAPKYFVPNMVLTVEPGIYIPEESIGVRIEDDILITATKHENLSKKLSASW